jgi:hypothetical protein
MTAHWDEADRAAASGGPRAYSPAEIQAMPPAPGMSKRCTCCGGPIVITPQSHARPMVLDFMYALIGECQEPRPDNGGPCFSTWCLVMWEEPE